MKEETKRDLIRISEAAREDALGYICNHWGMIIKNIAEKAEKDASVQHAKFLHEVAGFQPLLVVPEDSKSARQPKDEKQPKKLDAEFSLAQLILGTLAAFDRGEWSTN